ncbi:MAG: PAC2 family protein [Actinomycetia bacterium]|nr:PAC2 family protein [Actinomycetes bacterium]MCP4959899.1 PAC2 family protein [Actinomycetes bacterium]
MTQVQWHEAPSLRRPILLVAFEGWFDAGDSATSAVRWLADRYDASTVANIDPEEFFDFQETRPEVGIGPDGRTRVEWPDNRILAAQTDTAHDLLLLAGVEPRLQWRTFCHSLLEVVVETSTELVITVGSFVAAVPHSRAAPIQGSASDPTLASRLGLSRPSYQGPTGIVGVLHDTLDGAGVPIMSLRASVPHYVSGPTNPKGQQALLRRLNTVLGVQTWPERLDSTVRDWEERVDSAIATDEEVLEYVHRLEQDADLRSRNELVSGDDLADEIERFLRDRDDPQP